MDSRVRLTSLIMFDLSLVSLTLQLISSAQTMAKYGVSVRPWRLGWWVLTKEQLARKCALLAVLSKADWGVRDPCLELTSTSNSSICAWETLTE